MADQNMPNDASRKSKAEGDRWSEENDKAGREHGNSPAAERDAGGITNRPLDEERDNQESLPERGDARPGAHAGHGDTKKPNKPM